MTDLDTIYLKQLENVTLTYQTYREKNATSQSPSFWSTSETSHFNSLAVAAIDRITGPDSVYAQQAHILLEKRDSYTQHHLIGIVYALRDDIVNGFLTNLREVVHGELFSDFLDMADYLVKEGYKDAAAVMGGGVLESHLRQLCVKYGIDIEIVVGSDTKPKKADQLNSDLARNKIYNVLEQKSVAAWLDLRNKAAHAKYGEYTKDQVSLMLQGVRSFISRYPA